MDGNRRWAESRGLKEVEGHRKGMETLVSTVEEAVKLGIKNVTVYALSSENLKERSKGEIKDLLILIKAGYREYLPRLKKEGIGVNFIGNIEKLPRTTKLLIRKVEVALANGKRGKINIALNYGGREEIIRASESLSKRRITEGEFVDSLYTKGIPDPDLLIRTGGRKRLSNFLLWQLSYTELYFTDTLWPDFDKEELKKAIKFFADTKRNFGF